MQNLSTTTIITTYREFYYKIIFMLEKRLEKEDKTNNASTSFFPKLFKKIKFQDTDKQKIADQIINDSEFNFLYRLQLILSSSIATLWLLINSSSVVIWAMLISPLLMPIKVFSFSITTWNKHLYFRSFRTLLLSIILSVWVAYWISLVIPFTQLTSEIISRWSPTIVDLFIALASGAIAFMSLWFTRLSETIAWVAMASALLPPLCVIWISAEFMNREISQWSWLLFLANLIAILIIWIIILYFFWFSPRNKWWQTRGITSILLVFSTIILISIPLFKWMESITDDLNLNHSIKNTLNSFVKNIDEEIDISNLNYKKTEQNKIFVSAILNVPIWTIITDKHKQELTSMLALSTNKSIDLDLRLVDISSVYIDIKKEPTREEKIQNYIQSFFKQNYSEITVIDSKIAYQNDPIVLLELFTLQTVNEQNILSEIESWAKADLEENIVFIIQRQKKQQKPQSQFIKEQNLISQEFSKIFTWSSIEKLNVEKQTVIQDLNLLNQNLTWSKQSELSWYILNIEISFVTPIKEDITSSLQLFKNNIQSLIWNNISLEAEYRIFNKIDL